MKGGADWVESADNEFEYLEDRTNKLRGSKDANEGDCGWVNVTELWRRDMELMSKIDGDNIHDQGDRSKSQARCGMLMIGVGD